MVNAVGAWGAWFDLRNVPVRTLSFVRPAPANDAAHVAWYSDTTVLEHARVVVAGAHLGWRDGSPFAHVHGQWTEQDGRVHAGHLLAEVTVLGADHEVDVWTLSGARMESAYDEETGFTLFVPKPTQPVTRPNAVLSCVRPNEVIDDAVRTIGAGASRVTVKGLGSLVGTALEGQAGLDDHATEVLLTGGAPSVLDVVSVGFDGPPVAGALVPGANRVCVTFELLVLLD